MYLEDLASGGGRGAYLQKTCLSCTILHSLFREGLLCEGHSRVSLAGRKWFGCRKPACIARICTVHVGPGLFSMRDTAERP